jgi:hypothetical protein
MASVVSRTRASYRHFLRAQQAPALENVVGHTAILGRFECVVVLPDGVLESSLATELASGADKESVIEELLTDPGDCPRMGIDKLGDVRRAVGRGKMRQENRRGATAGLVNVGQTQLCVV